MILKPIFNLNVNNYYSRKTNRNNNIYSLKNSGDIFLKNNIPFAGTPLHNNYEEWFKTYLKYSDEKISIAKHIGNIISENKFYSCLNKKQEIKILDIGCGNGLLTENVINKFNQLFPKKQVQIDALDINDNLLNDFRKRFSKYDNKLNLNAEKQDYFKFWDENKKYDLIIASHVLYYADNLDNALLKIFNNLSNEGKAIIVHHSGQGCILSEFRAKYNPLSYANLNQTSKQIKQDDIIQNSLNKQNFSYKMLKQYFNLKIPNYRERKDFKNLISFLIDKPYSSLVKEGTIERLLEDIKNASNNQKNLYLFNNMYVINKEYI